MAVSRNRSKIVQQLALVPNMIARGHHIRAELEELIGDLRRHAEAARRVLDVHDGEINLVSLAHMADMLAHNPAPRAAKDVADKQNVQWSSFFWSDSDGCADSFALIPVFRINGNKMTSRIEREPVSSMT